MGFEEMTGKCGDPAPKNEGLPDEAGKGRIPEAVKKGIDMFVNHGVRPGSFVTAVLENDLMRAWGQADLESRREMDSILRYVWYEIPSGSWGSPDRVEAWIQKVREGEEREEQESV